MAKISLLAFNQLQVSVELGLCEMMNREAISPGLAPKDGNWGFDVAEREAMLPTGTVDRNVKRVNKEVDRGLDIFQFMLSWQLLLH